jgi:hypothetical protein
MEYTAETPGKVENFKSCCYREETPKPCMQAEQTHDSFSPAAIERKHQYRACRQNKLMILSIERKHQYHACRQNKLMILSVLLL